MCELAPETCVDINILGVKNVIAAAIEQNVEKVIFTSSDKAVNPTNVMGATKLIGERLFLSASQRLSRNSSKHTKFAATRFGNVLGSTGSVLPVFVKQIVKGEQITITSPDMSRFMMSQSEAADLVIKTAEITQGNELFIMKMPVLNLWCFAEVLFNMCEEAGLSSGKKFSEQASVIGLRSGEKLYEELMTDEERLYSKEGDKFFVLSRSELDFEASQEDAIRWPMAEVTYNSKLLEPLSFQETKEFIANSLQLDGMKLSDFAS
jgi:UDP-N-acetylglucosamine 4,6-dehydratase/5-epimerase